MLAVVPVPESLGQIQMTHGLNFSPYLDSQDPNQGSQIGAEQIAARLQIIAPYTKWIRTFSSTHGLEQIPSSARQLGLKVAGGAWISTDSAQNAIEINNLIAAANARHIDVAIVGSEAILRKDVSVAQLIAYMNQVRSQIPADIPVTTADVWGTFMDQPSLIAASDIVFSNFYPYWEGTSINNAICSLQQQYQQLVNVSGGKPVWVSEAGWPSAGNTVGAAVPSVANANLFALQFLSWAAANEIPSFYFEAFDENWKAAYEGLQGAHWGIWDSAGSMKPGADAFFNGASVNVDCNGPIPGPVGIAPLYIPPYGTSDFMQVQVTGVQPLDYRVATYINVSGLWWTKPTSDDKTVAINPDGTVSINIVTGGSDQLATAIAVFLIPSDCDPPLVLGGSLPSLPCSVAGFQVSRTQDSIRGTIRDNLNRPIFGATINGGSLGTTTSAPDGKYSFYNVSSVNPVELAVTYPNYVFPSSPTQVNIGGPQTANFSGSPTADLVANLSLSASAVQAGATLTATVIVSNAGIAAANDSVVAVSLPDSFVVDSVSATRGSCAATPPISCQLGVLQPTATATITLVVRPSTPGVFALSALASTSIVELDSVNNSSEQAILVNLPPSPTLTGLSPSFARRGSEVEVTIAGTGLHPGFTVSPGIGISASNVTAISTTSGTTRLSIAPNAELGPRNLTITNAAGVSNSVEFSVLPSNLRRDFDGSGSSDILWRNLDGTVAVWLMNRFGFLQAGGLGTIPSSWTIAGTGDLNGDGKSDIVWRNVDGTVAVWLMNGLTINQGAVLGVIPASWTIVATGDLNGDGRDDLVWRHTDGTVAVWLMDGATLSQGAVLGTIPMNWTIAGTGDLNGDRREDLVWRHTDGTVAVWLMDGVTLSQGVLLGTIPISWTIPGVGDLNGDGRDDLVWRNTDGTAAVWLMNGATVSQTAVLGAVPVSSTVAGTDDYSGDGKTDILWRNADGTVDLWLMDGSTITETLNLGAVPGDWVIQNPR